MTRNHHRSQWPGRCIRVLLATAVIGSPRSATAQQEPALALYMWNMLAINPAHAGTGDRLSAALTGRQQWAGLAGAPRTQAFAAHAPFAANRLAAGISVLRDDVGPARAMRTSADIAYRFRTSRKMRLALGLKAGVEWMQLNLAEVPDVLPDDPVFQQNQRTGAHPNFGFGAYWWGANGFVALSAPRLLEYDAGASANGGTVATQQRTYMLSAGRVVRLTDDVKLQGWGLMKSTAHVPIVVDATLTAVLHEQFWIGVSKHGTGTLAGVIAYRFMNRVHAAYAYGASIGSLRSRNDGTHEIMIGYDMPIRSDRTLSPRYF